MGLGHKVWEVWVELKDGETIVRDYVCNLRAREVRDAAEAKGHRAWIRAAWA
jgi:hypothetical protein